MRVEVRAKVDGEIFGRETVMNAARSTLLSPAMKSFLEAIRDCEDEYALQERLEVWVGDRRFSPRTVLKCLQYCLIKEDCYTSPGTHIWVLTECGRKIIEDPSYVPLIVRELRKSS
jgi:hypothetical protein